ncbi:LuxR family transcriptional regulator [Actinomadura sp. B10D3]|uniref:helix-turn-helix transcriptional regulator n=1 Tax=Actinomadura sp. B10D3 TaxID=3153557 RepID=UPI00325EE454
MLYGRDGELAAIDGLLRRARDGHSGTLALRGEAGIGKSALLDHAAAADGMRVLRATGVENESAMPYAGLHLLLGRFADRFGGLPEQQGLALCAALNMGGRPGEGDRFLVGLAVLTLLSDLAEERPLLVLVDDAHWMDAPSAGALLFAARRLEAEPIAMIFAARDADAPEFAAEGIPELRLRGLDRDAARRLLAERTATLPGRMEQEVLVAAMGNPLALLELPARGGHGSAYERIRRSYAERIAALPERARRLLLLVASDDLGDVGVIVAAAGRCGASVDDAAPAERAGLLRTTADGRLEVRHPLIRTAAVEEAPLNARLAAHRALAEAYRERGDDCHHAWHLISGVTEPEERIAALLEKTAETERDAGGNASVAAMYEAAAELSEDRAERGRRLAAAARAAADAGLPERAVQLAARAEPDLPDPVARAELTLTRASLADEQDRTRDAYRLFAETAASVVDLDPQTSGYLYFQAASAAANAGDFAALDDIVAEGVRAGVPNASHLRALSRVFAGQRPLATGAELADGVAALRELMEAMGTCYGPRDRIRAGLWHLLVGDLRGAAEAAAALERRHREEGSIGLLAAVLMLRSRTDLLLGRHRDALTAASEGRRIAADTGQQRIRVYLDTVLAQLAAIGGDERRCAELTEEALARGVPPSSVHAASARALLDLGLGRYEAAVERLSDVLSGPNRQGAIAALPDLVEAAVRAGVPERAREAGEWYGTWAAHVGRPWAEAIAARCAALLTPDDPDALYSRALELHREGGTPFEQARTELLYGEWLRRSRRRNDARARLHSALEAFDRLGAAPWVERARAELRAAGESLTDGGDGRDVLAGRLTPQELQVVRLAATGLSNREIGAQLFLSPRTVGYHLYKAYPKLGVAGRAELGRLDLN